MSFRGHGIPRKFHGKRLWVFNQTSSDGTLLNSPKHPWYRVAVTWRNRVHTGVGATARLAYEACMADIRYFRSGQLHRLFDWAPTLFDDLKDKMFGVDRGDEPVAAPSAPISAPKKDFARNKRG